MDISDVKDKQGFSTAIVNELKKFGVKFQKEKKRKNVQDKANKAIIFRNQLDLLELSDVILANGRVVQIPKFIADACNRILEQVEVEGIFRKAGSFIRQKEMRISIEAGVPLGKLHHVVDVANIIKYFFRELPEPLISVATQETLLRCLLVGENCVKAILLTCLLLPPLTMNTLSFFMQFLFTVSLSQNLNKMSVENLAIIFTPGLMPFPNVNTHRFTNHVKIVRILIENANDIGVVPKSIENKLQGSLNTIVSQINLSQENIPTKNTVKENGSNAPSAKKKKNRRSDMFNGLKKIVGSAIGSTEYLDYMSIENTIPYIKENGHCTATTSSIKENKKRKHVEQAVSAIKKESKKSRLSLSGGRHIKNPDETSMERRWSIVGSGWAKNKIKNGKVAPSNKCILNIESSKDNTEYENTSLISKKDICIGKNVIDTSDDSDCIEISKVEYKEIKDSVVAIENRISYEFDALSNSVNKNASFSSDTSGATKDVQVHYERMVLETDALSSSTTEHLAQRFRRDLNIRQSTDQRVIRSPSARKIGTIRQRSQDKKRISRDSSWHNRLSNNMSICKDSNPLPEHKNSQNHIESNIFYAKNKKKFQAVNSIALPNDKMNKTKNSIDNFVSNECENEQWVSGEEFFCNQTHAEHVTTPVNRKNYFDLDKTPMLPPKSLPRRFVNIKTPLNAVIKPSTTSKLTFVNRIAISTPVIEEVSGRASIARLRAQNAGMVMAKAKLFDELGNNCSNEQQSINLHKFQNSTELHHNINSVRYNSKSTALFKQCDTALLETKSTTPLKITPIGKRIQNVNNPASSSKRKPRGNASKNYNKNIIKSIVDDDNLTKHCALNLDKVKNVCSKGDTLKTTSYARNPKSPRRIKKGR